MIWIRIILYVLMLIIEGLSEEEAVANASGYFGVSVSDIFKHL